MYDEIATLYHLIYRDWNAAIVQQAAALDAIIRQHVGPPPRSILDVSCGIGTQALGLAALGHAVTASDLHRQPWSALASKPLNATWPFTSGSRTCVGARRLTD